MKKFLFLLITLFIAFTSCKKISEVKILPDLTIDEISAKRVWERITVEENYKKYPKWPGHEGMQPGQSPHGRFHRVYINPKFRNALPIEDKIAPKGSIIVKENFTADKEFLDYTIMVKVKDYDPKNNDWFWVEFDEVGKTKVAGKVKFCSDCHAGSNNDFLILRKLDEPIE